MNRRLLIIASILIICIFSSGCETLMIPFKIAELAFDVIDQAVQLAGKLPTPPPGVF